MCFSHGNGRNQVREAMWIFNWTGLHTSFISLCALRSLDLLREGWEFFDNSSVTRSEKICSCAPRCMRPSCFFPDI